MLVLFATLVIGYRLSPARGGGRAIQFDLAEDCEVSIGLRDESGKFIGQLISSEPMKRGRQVIPWDGKGSGGQTLAPGNYRWMGWTHAPFTAQLRGWAGLNGTPQWPPNGAGNPWGQQGGAPAAVAADDAGRVYLGWSSGALVASDLEGHILWSESLPYERHVQALAVDGRDGFVLARNDLGNDEILKFDTHRGIVTWAEKRIRREHAGLRILDLWPPGDPTLPSAADAIAACAGRIYLTFAGAQFMVVLDSATGEYLQTVVGGSPEYLAVTTTRAEVEDGGGLKPADFAAISLQGGGLAKVLFGHDPLWVISSKIESADPAETITALAIVGDSAPSNARSIFLGVASPAAQVQRRDILSSEGYVWSAGRAEGRPYTGAWDPTRLALVRGLALDSRGRLWVAEGDAVPPRFSVWSTDGKEGRLEHEFFGPVAPEDWGAAVLPGDPGIVVGGGCEWRLD